MDSILKLVDVDLISSDTPVPRLKGINLNIAKGEFILLFGEGEKTAGKTSLLNVLSTYEKPTNGKFFIKKVDVSQREELYKRIIRDQLYHDERIKQFYASLKPPIIRTWQSTLTWLNQKRVSAIMLENMKNFYPRAAFYELEIDGMQRVWPFLTPNKANKSKHGWRYKEAPPEAHVIGKDEEAAKKYLKIEWRLPPEYFNFKFEKLSGGFKRQVLNAAAFLGFCVEDAVLIADCPDLNLDIFKRNMLAFHLIDRHKSGHTIVAVITHTDIQEILIRSIKDIRQLHLKIGRLSAS